MTGPAVERPEWATDPDGPGSGDDRYGEVPAQERAEGDAT